MKTVRIHLIALSLFLAACDGLADDSNTGEVLARLGGTVTGSLPDEPVRLTTVWGHAGGLRFGEDGCSPWSSTIANEQHLQEVDSFEFDGDQFRVELNAPPPSEAFFPGYDFGFDDPNHPEYSIPFEFAIGVLVAYVDSNENGRLDPCHDSNCADQVLGSSNVGDNYLRIRSSSDGAARTELGLGNSPFLPDDYEDSPMALLFLTEPWKPYGAREVPAGYVVLRERADVVSGERFIDGFDPAMNIEIPLSANPLFEEFRCDGGCVGSFVHGEAECPDLETGWCTARPEMPPADAEYRGIQCRWLYDENGNQGEEVCNPVWSSVTWGCDRFAEVWLGCPVPGPDSPPDPSWSCLP